MLLNEHKTDQGILVTVCDADIVGDTFENGDVSLTVEADFYAEEADQADETTVVDALDRANIANIVGTQAVGLAVEHEIIDETTVLDVGDTQHAQLLRF